MGLEAVQWWRNGDHPDDGVGQRLRDTFSGQPYIRQEGLVVRYYRPPTLAGEQLCGHCSRRMHEHGWIDEDCDRGGHVVCPGDWIITVRGAHYPCRPALFEVLTDAGAAVASAGT